MGISDFMAFNVKMSSDTGREKELNSELYRKNHILEDMLRENSISHESNRALLTKKQETIVRDFMEKISSIKPSKFFERHSTGYKKRIEALEKLNKSLDITLKEFEAVLNFKRSAIKTQVLIKSTENQGFKAVFRHDENAGNVTTENKNAKNRGKPNCQIQDTLRDDALPTGHKESKVETVILQGDTRILITQFNTEVIIPKEIHSQLTALLKNKGKQVEDIAVRLCSLIGDGLKKPNATENCRPISGGGYNGNISGRWRFALTNSGPAQRVIFRISHNQENNNRTITFTWFGDHDKYKKEVIGKGKG